MTAPRLSALVVAHNEERQLAACLERLAFADEIVVVLDRCDDASATIAGQFTERLIEGAWPLEGDRRNAGIEACAAGVTENDVAAEQPLFASAGLTVWYHDWECPVENLSVLHYLLTDGVRKTKEHITSEIRI